MSAPFMNMLPHNSLHILRKLQEKKGIILAQKWNYPVTP